MAFTKSTKPPKKVKLPKPEEIPEVTLTLIVMNQKMTEIKQQSRRMIMTLMVHISHCCSTRRHPHRIDIQGLEVQLLLLKCHTDSGHQISLTKKKQNEPDQVTVQEEATSWWTITSCPGKEKVHNYTGSPKGKKSNEAPHINDCSSPLSVLLLFFAEVITLLRVETNQYYQYYLDLLL
jgi:hypothetical protein